MSSNETVEEIAKEMCDEWAQVYYSEGTRRKDGEYCDNEFAAIEPKTVAARIEAAHKREMNHRALIAGVSLADAVDDAHKRELAAKDAEIAELRELLIELANAAKTAFDDIAKCGSIIADGDVRDAAYRTHLMERIAKYRKALKGVNK